MNSTPRNRFQDFIDDQSFVDWVKHPTSESDKYWEEYLTQHPLEKDDFDQARYMLLKFQKEKHSPKDHDAINVWLNIQSRILTPSRKIRFITRWSVAASVLLIIGAGSFIFTRIQKDTEVNYAALVMKEPAGNEVKLILSDNSEKKLVSEDPSVKYGQDGQILVDSVALSDKQTAPGKTDAEAFNQLIVPKGKRSSLILSDGTKLYLNSGSQVIYPVTFNKKTREIYIRGEAYLEVAHNVNCPFIVKMDNLDVKVFGTEFNVKSYPDDPSSSVVLVKGKVQAILKSQKIMMAESQLLTLDNATKKTSLEKSNVLEYVSWKDGWMFCTNEKIESIAKKLSRYYDVNIQFNESVMKDITLTGKLDLKTDYREVFDVISFISPVDYEIVGENIILSLKNK